MPSAGYVFMGSWGCLLPLLIIFNLFFGKLIFNSTALWLGVEALLVLIFMFKIRLMVSTLSRQFDLQGRNPASADQSFKPNDKVIDVQGQEVKEDKKLT